MAGASVETQLRFGSIIIKVQRSHEWLRVTMHSNTNALKTLFRWVIQFLLCSNLDYLRSSVWWTWHQLAACDCWFSWTCLLHKKAMLEVLVSLGARLNQWTEFTFVPYSLVDRSDEWRLSWVFDALNIGLWKFTGNSRPFINIGQNRRHRCLRVAFYQTVHYTRKKLQIRLIGRKMLHVARYFR